jgi:hypothetical protein
MKWHQIPFSAACLMLFVINVSATVFYVDANGTNPTPPYTNWLTAATNIQDAIGYGPFNVHSGDTIWVTNGVYQFGVALSSRVYLPFSASVTLQSINGPDVTFIVGVTNNTASQTRCVYLGGPQTLSGFTLTNGGAGNGGGVYCPANNAIVSNCVIVGSWCSNGGGGANSGTLINCVLKNNYGGSGGGANSSTLINCILSGNLGSSGAGAYASTLSNCIVTNNIASSSGGGAYSSVLINTLVISNKCSAGAGVYSSSLTNCSLIGNFSGVLGSFGSGGGAYSSVLHNCFLAQNFAGYDGGAVTRSTIFNCTVISNTGGPVGGALGVSSSACNSIIFYNWYNDYSGSGFTNCCYQGATNGLGLNNTIMPPLFVDLAGGNYHLASNSPCINTGTNLYVKTQVDLDGNPRIYGGTVDMGAYENQSVTQANAYTYYVNASNAAPVSPYITWDTAATNIQDAIDIANAGSPILVTNGLYAYGGRVMYGSMSNRAAVNKSLSLQSINGPDVTIIMGNGGDTGPAATGVRCVYLGTGTSLSGFTLTNGATRNSGDGIKEQSGGGIWCETNTVIVTNCVIAGNQANNYGGGAYQGTYFNCTFQSNSTVGNGGGAAYGVLNNCTIANNKVTLASSIVYGGGAYFCTLSNCLLMGNRANTGGGAAESTLFGCIVATNLASGSTGGGVYHSTVTGSLIISNNAMGSGGGGGGYNSTFFSCIITNNISKIGPGGGVNSGRLNNCLISKNSASTGGGAAVATLNNCVLAYNTATGSAGGASQCILNNTIALLNSAPSGSNYSSSTMNFCCTLPDAGGNNIAIDPLFVNAAGGDFHLQSNSPASTLGKTPTSRTRWTWTAIRASPAARWT